ncbi:hypothetical protein BD410DRAFT_838700 [Rickenella mellea]|uniref:Endoplasmic reticulum-based factor for assembly of V-ATPase n=1 Tax=Rickenella mellea TaxID=50990 RepID=A0A4Y7Q992_9AGAM|nr:hypothetical protein BD410DRAFT_838700 [Rickenella mellea]
MPSVNSELTVSLEPFLQEELKPLIPILPSQISSRLSSEISLPEIHYELLSDISKWSRSDLGKASLQAQNLEPSAYSMVSLLAGTVTAPSSKPPPYTPPDTPEEAARYEINDKKTITAILNALLSIGGSGAATWWAADKSGWRGEWKVLLSLLVATVVAVSETILYIIWQSRKNRRPTKRVQHVVHGQKKMKQTDNSISDIPTAGDADVVGLRRRILATVPAEGDTHEAD